MREPPILPGKPLKDGWLYLGKQLDTVQEAWDYQINDGWAAELERLRLKAQAMADDGEGLAPMPVAGEILQVRSTGAKGGFAWVAGNDDFLLLIKRGGARWSVSVRYLAGGLWEEGGIDALVDRVKDVLDTMGKPNDDDYRRLSRIDVAFDFYAPGFKETAFLRLAEGALMPARCKGGIAAMPPEKIGLVFSRSRIQTLTLGLSKHPSVQVQLYNKTLEITEASGKDWMYTAWEKEGLPRGVRSDIWRVEVRLFKDWLQDRGVRRLSEFRLWQYALVREAISSRRLTVPSEDKNRARWPLHPFWTIVQEEAVTPILAPRGRYVTGRRDALDRMMTRMYGGGLLSQIALNNPGLIPTRDDLMPLAEKIVADALSDPQRMEKVLDNAFERYRHVEEAR
jgi:hypothetical protein